MDNELQTTNNVQTEENQAGTQPVVAPVTSDRTTEQFSKLTESNTALNAQNADLQRQLQEAKALAAPKAPKAPAAVETPIVKTSDPIDVNAFVEVDKKTGERYINETKLNKAIEDLKSQTTQAKTTIQDYIKTNEDRRIQTQKDTAFAAHPELDPASTTHDKKFYQTVRAVLADSMMNSEEYGKVMSLKEAADYVRGELIKPTPVKDAGEEEKQDSTAKADAGTLVPSQPQNMPQPAISDELKLLRMATRQGSTQALAQRILGTDHVIKPS